MKILFFSSDHSEVELVAREFVEAGIPCEIRVRDIPERAQAFDAELWIQNDEDWYIVFEVDMAGMSIAAMTVARRSWAAELFQHCPSTHVHLFRLGRV